MSARANVTVNVRWMAAGHCLNIEGLTRRGAPWRIGRYPAGFALIEHPTRGPVLFDTGYHPRFHAATARFPQRAYALLTPVRIKAHETAAAQLTRRGVDPGSVTEVIISHFHADHVCGLRDFPNARLRYDERAWAAVRDLRGVAAVRRAFLPDLLPTDFEARSEPFRPGDYRPLDADLAPFEVGADVFGDGSAFAVPLPGHAHGQVGLLVRAHDGLYFLAADAAWSSEALRSGARPHPLATQVFSDRAAERRSFEQSVRFVHAHPGVRLCPSHCPEALGRHGGNHA